MQHGLHLTIKDQEKNLIIFLNKNCSKSILEFIDSWFDVIDHCHFIKQIIYLKTWLFSLECYSFNLQYFENRRMKMSLKTSLVCHNFICSFEPEFNRTHSRLNSKQKNHPFVRINLCKYQYIFANSFDLSLIM